MNRIFKELINTTFGSSAKSLLPDGQASYPQLIPINPATHHTPDGSGDWAFQFAGGEYRYFKYTGFGSCVRAYEECPPVSAIINRKAQAYINGKIWVLNSKNKEAESVIATKVKNLLLKPNAVQSWKQFEAQGYIYQKVFGFNIILPIFPSGFTDPTDATSLWNIPASWIDLPATQENFTRLGGITLTEIVLNFNGKQILLKLKDLIIIRDTVPSFRTLTFPESPLYCLQMPINNIIGAYESRNMLINYRGALGILTSDPGSGQYTPMPLEPNEKANLQREFRQYGLRARQMQVIMTTAQLKWQQMGYSTKDLMLLEEVEESTVAVCANLNFPAFILGLRDTTFNNMNAAERTLYQNAIIPDAENIYQQLTTWFQLERYNLHLDKDYSHIPVLQDDRKTLADARYALNKALEVEWRNGMITLNQWLEKNGEDPLSDARGQMFFPEYVAAYGDPQKGAAPANTQQNEQQGQQQPNNTAA